MPQISSLLSTVSNFFTKGNQRSLKAKKNIVASLLIRGVSILVGFYLVPLSLGYLGSEELYGVWLTLSSLFAWFNFFDVGLGNGLRNKFTVAVAKDEHSLAKVYVSTTYAMLVIIISVVFLIFLAIYPFLDWIKILNTTAVMEKELALLALYGFGFFCLQFVFKLIGTILTADQKPSANNLILFLSQFTSLIIIYILSKTTQGSILYLGLAVTGSPVLIFLITTIILFTTSYKRYAPSLKHVDFKYAKGLMRLGTQFFVIQMAAIMLFATDNMILTQIMGPAEVTPYNIAHKYFGMITMIFVIVMSPFWSAFTDAWTKNDIKWIKKIIGKLTRFWFLFLGMAIFMLLVSRYVYLIWVGDQVHVPFTLSLTMAIFMLLQAFNLIFVNFINGVGKLRIQMFTGIFSILFNIPLSILFAKHLGLGSPGVILATIVSIGISIILRTIQYKKLISGTATGVWNK
ncbi:polysaccharide biosynthesis protein [Fulvivirgaceae bacterium BMA10]|uniref:Polysaccharide biosynthesis protein n=1 Tax=Splendidivirga corallicola TaxID=3051826 RepID=A0ABT8KXB6_9BACT|nr:polysaccharide biosynthesis protein [Fulvivirgaceae bacterium BMA10]